MKKLCLIIMILSFSTLVAQDSFGCQVAYKQFKRQNKEMKRANEINDRSQYKASLFWAISSLKSIYVKCDNWKEEDINKIKDLLEHYKETHARMTQEDGY